MKKTLAILACISAIGLTACSHNNPIETEPKNDSIKFLMKASSYAELKINYKVKTHGVVYYGCMLKRYGGQLATKEDCTKFFNYMLEYAHKSDSPYSNLTFEDLTNEKVFEGISSEYGQTYRKKADKNDFIQKSN